MTHSFAQPVQELEQKIIESILSLVSNPIGRNRPTKPETYKEPRNRFKGINS